MVTCDWMKLALKVKGSLRGPAEGFGSGKRPLRLEETAVSFHA